MKTIILALLAVFFVACKGTNNQTSKDQVISAYERKAFLVIPHNNDSSILREKLLHGKLNDQLKVSSQVKPEPRDEFRFAVEKFEQNRAEQLEFELLLNSSAEIIVSYSDRTEIYFVPSGIPRDQAFLGLPLRPEDGRFLDWATETPSILSKRTTYFVLSYSKDDLLKNDRKFFAEKLPISSDVSRPLGFTPSQKISIQFFISYFERETNFTSLKAKPLGSCKSERMEAGLCDVCSAQIERTTGSLLNMPWSLENFELSIVVNGKEYSMKELNPKVASANGSLIIELDLLNFKTAETVEVKLQNPVILPQVKDVAAFNHQGYCPVNFPATKLDVTPVVQMTYQVTVFGRNLK